MGEAAVVELYLGTSALASQIRLSIGASPATVLKRVSLIIELALMWTDTLLSLQIGM